MDINIRQEKQTDYDAVFELIKRAFEKIEMSDHKEHFLVQRLRNSTSFVPQLSLVAEYENEIVGHILLTKIKIKNDQTEFQSLALAPVTVLPKYQKKGIGGMLIEQAHKKATELGFKSVILLGHADYYPRFGYKKASGFGVKLPSDVPDEYYMAIELVTDGLKEVNGMVEYPKEFNE